ncbi:MAG: 1-acyl-sn-glycerol-3-phosphate acyltransferase [Bdellovibrionales bacterium]|nr:1-acyl-sn-glycerol-3-phosphate acyltransferase [Bdellovibrionales bacterium]
MGSIYCKGVKWGDFIQRNWACGLLWPLNIQIEVKGVENLSKENGIIVFNHASHFDIPILFRALRKKTIRFGAKAELFKIPVFGSAMRGIGALEIHRGQRERVIKLYERSLKNLAKGYNYVLAPEGTRQASGELGDFKMGPFIMALAGNCPVFPVVIVGAYNIMPKHSTFPMWGVWSMKVKVKILPAISTVGMSMDQRQLLRDKVREQMAKALMNSSGPIEG